MRKIVPGWALVGIVPVLAGGWWFAGYLTLLLLGLTGSVPLAWNTYGPYTEAIDLPEVEPYAFRIRLAGAFGVGAPLLAWLALMYRAFGRAVFDRDARLATRFASRDEVKRHGLMGATPGIALGRFGRRSLDAPADKHVLLCAPRHDDAGRTSIVATLLRCDDSAVVLDPGGHYRRKTSGHRATVGPVHVLRPFASDRRTMRWNPLTYVPDPPAQRRIELEAIAETLYGNESRMDRDRIPLARDLFVTLATYLFESHDADRRAGVEPAWGPPTLGQVHALCPPNAGDPRILLKSLGDKPFLGSDARAAFRRFNRLSDKRLFFAVEALSQTLCMLDDPWVDHALATDDVDLRCLTGQRATIYVDLPDDASLATRSLARLFLSQAIAHAGERRIANRGQLFVLDHVPAIGRIGTLPEALRRSRNSGTRFLLATERPIDLERVYGSTTFRDMLRDIPCRAIHRPWGRRDANDYRILFSFDDTLAPGDAHRPGFDANSWPMLPLDMESLTASQALVLIASIEQPIRCDTIRYDQDARLAARLLLPVTVKPLDLGDTSMPSTILQTLGTATALAFAATSCTQQKTPTAPPPLSEAALAEEARKDGLSIEDERILQQAASSRDPNWHWDGYSDKPVALKLGPNTFMLPMNLYYGQVGPTKDTTYLTLHWPSLEPFPPGSVRDPSFAESYLDESISIGLTYVDRRPIETLLNDTLYRVTEYNKDDPTATLASRLRGDAIFGLTPYYSDIPKITAHFRKKGYPTDEHNIHLWADDWYINVDQEGNPRSIITCSTREMAGARLIDDRLETTPVGVPRGMCTHTITIDKFRLDVRISYLRAYLRDWKPIEDKVRALLDRNLVTR